MPYGKLSGTGWGGVDTSIITAGAGDVLAGKVIVDKDGNPLTGTMHNRGAVSQALNAGGSYVIPAGYHNGSGKVSANSLASQTDATATAAQILSGYSAWSKGVKYNGSMVNRGAVTQTLNAGGSYVIPAGYHNGSGKVTANSLANQTSATATAAQILNGQTAWMNGVKYTGTMPNHGAVAYVADATNNGVVSIPEGYHNGNGHVYGLAEEDFSKIDTTSWYTTGDALFTGTRCKGKMIRGGVIIIAVNNIRLLNSSGTTLQTLTYPLQISFNSWYTNQIYFSSIADWIVMVSNINSSTGKVMINVTSHNNAYRVQMQLYGGCMAKVFYYGK